MSDYYFFYPSRALSSSLARRAFISGRWRAAVETETRVETLSPTRNLLVARADSDASGYLNVPLVGTNDVFFYASTESLPGSDRFIPLFLELARGQLSRLVRKSCDWSLYGLVAPKSIRLGVKRALAQFATLVTSDYDAPNYDAHCLSLFHSLRKLSFRFNEYFLAKALTARRNLATPWETRFGFSAGIDENWQPEYDDLFLPRRKGRARAKLEPLFQTFNPTFSWADIEKEDGSYDWTLFDAAYVKADARDLKITLGPLIRWGEALPAQYQRADWRTVADAFKRYLEALVSRDAGRARRWIVATNVEKDVVGLSLEARLSLAAQTAIYISTRFPNAQIFLGFEQAFGDAARFGRHLYMAPFEMASRIARRKLFDGFYVEVNFGVSRSATPPRDPMEFHTFFDRWCSIGVPISVGTSCPSSPPALFTDSEDPTVFASERDAESSFSWFWGRRDKGERTRSASEESNVLLSDLDSINSDGSSFFINETLWTEKTQLETARRFVSSAIARRSVDEIIWTRWRDEPPYVFDVNEDSPEAREFNARPHIALNACPEPPSSVVGDQKEVRQCVVIDPSAEDSDTDFDLCDESEATEPLSESSTIESCKNVYPTSGLFDTQGKMKPTVQKLSALKRAFLS